LVAVRFEPKADRTERVSLRAVERIR